MLHVLEELPRTTSSPDETLELARLIAEAVEPPLVIGLYGDLGSGKTQFVKGFCGAVGIPMERVTSPTYTIANEYHGSVTVYHLDAYRIGDIDELYEFGYERYFYEGGICLVEWADRVEDLLPEHTLRLKFEHLGDSKRRIALVSEQTGPAARTDRAGPQD